MPLFSYIDTTIQSDQKTTTYKIIRKQQKKPQAFRSFNYVEKYIRATYGYKIADDIVLNCAKKLKPIDTVFVFKTETISEKIDEWDVPYEPDINSEYDDLF